MNRRIVLSNSFRRSYKSFLKKHPEQKEKIEDTILMLEEDVYDPSLKTHKLSGKLLSLSASSCGFDCRIIFKIVKDKIHKEEVIILVSIGDHKNVY
jgi:mRNA interferase YafQ